jgi:hypothetical protein
MTRAFPHAAEIEPQDSKANCSKGLCEGSDNVVLHIPAMQGMRMAEDEPGHLSGLMRLEVETLARALVS